MTQTEEQTCLGTWRCGQCGRVMAKMRIIEGTIQIKCERCGFMNSWPLSHRV